MCAWHHYIISAILALFAFLFFYKDSHEGRTFDFSSSLSTHTVFVILIIQINLI